MARDALDWRFAGWFGVLVQAVRGIISSGLFSRCYTWLFIRWTQRPRGIDAMLLRASTGTSTSFPMYDAHGNMIATLARSGASFALGNQRGCDAWGGIRVGSATGDPKGRYCAQLGHVQDDESGLIYMRARYYEPRTGRFVSEDPGRHRHDWFAYCASNPVNASDNTGKYYLLDLLLAGIGGLLLIWAVPELVIIGIAVGVALIIAGAAAAILDGMDMADKDQEKLDDAPYDGRDARGVSLDDQINNAVAALKESGSLPLILAGCDIELGYWLAQADGDVS